MADSYVKLAVSKKNQIRNHLRLLTWLGILLRVLVAFLALLASYLPPFDSSADILLEDASRSLFKRWIATSFRWDAFHFLHVAQNTSYVFDYEWAFFPGVPLLSRVSGSILTLGRYPPGTYALLAGHYALSTFLTPATARTLYELTMQHTGKPNLAFLSSCLSLLPSSPATFTLAPYAEPWFAFFSYKGMLYCTERRWTRASLCFALTTLFRSNGIFLGGFILWGMIIEPLMSHRQITSTSALQCIILSILPVLPFAVLQGAGYYAFCTLESSASPSWCSRLLPLIYGHVQSYYWNNGFLRYWTVQQLPNFILAAPVLFLLGYSSLTHISLILPSMLFSPQNIPQKTPSHPLLAPSILPHAIHAFLITCLLLFVSHTQIILRLASSMPFTYWSAARLFAEHPKCARGWVAWSIVWGATSVVLWTTFLPPA